MGYGGGKGEGHAHPTDMHTYSHLREAPYSACGSALVAAYPTSRRYPESILPSAHPLRRSCRFTLHRHASTLRGRVRYSTLQSQSTSWIRRASLPTLLPLATNHPLFAALRGN